MGKAHATVIPQTNTTTPTKGFPNFGCFRRRSVGFARESCCFFFRYFVMFLFCRTKQPIHQPPSFPRRRESRLQKAAAIFKDFHNFQNLDSRLRGNDEAGIFHLHLLKRPSEKPKTGFSAGLFVFDSNPTSKYSRYALPAHGCGGRGLHGRSRI